MRKTDFYLAILFILIVGFSFLSLQSNKVIGQTTSSSSSSSSSSGASATSSSSSGAVATSSSSGTASTSSGSGVVATSSSSGSTTQVSLSSNFNGVWKARVERPIISANSSSSSSGAVVSSSSSSGTVSTRLAAHLSDGFRGSNIITFKLCVKDGKLEGIVQQGGAFIGGKITSQTIISENEVEFTVTSKDGRTAKIRLKLVADNKFEGTFADGHKFIGRKLNSFGGCFEPNSSSGGPTMGGHETSSGDHGTDTHPHVMGGPGMGGPGDETSSSGGHGMSSGEHGGTETTSSGGSEEHHPHPPAMGGPFGFMGGPGMNDLNSSGG
ncbi:MAG: hypothetical protein HY094_06745 [Candidatus Melainabacteria bacterium]|nr:hypothetical protein [Candidatus Melainabacteria bacterium]